MNLAILTVAVSCLASIVLGSHPPDFAKNGARRDLPVKPGNGRLYDLMVGDLLWMCGKIGWWQTAVTVVIPIPIFAAAARIREEQGPGSAEAFLLVTGLLCFVCFCGAAFIKLRKEPSHGD